MGRIALAGVLVGLVGGVIASEPAIPASHQMVGSVIEYTVARGETLASIGARVGVDVATMAAMNRLQGAKLTPGQVLTVDARHIVPAVPGAFIVINVPQRMLFLVDDNTPVEGFPVGLGGRTWPTPTGRFLILTKEVDPTWDVPVSIQREMQRQGKQPLIKVAPGPDNPLGDRWFGLSLPGVGIHGTNAPASIYHHQTHGCVRLHPDDVRALFDRVQVGAAGEIIYQPVLLAVVEDRVYVESHRDVYRQFSRPLERLRESADLVHLTEAIDWRLATRVVRDQAGIARDVTAARRVPDCRDRPCQ
jgi:L,D-transpeptidase ErfK/SrfK